MWIIETNWKSVSDGRLKHNVCVSTHKPRRPETETETTKDKIQETTRDERRRERGDDQRQETARERRQPETEKEYVVCVLSELNLS